MNHKSLYKSDTNRMIAGVCGGLGEYFGIDPTIVRVSYTVLTFLTGGVGIPLYLVLAVIIPHKSEAK